MKIEITNPATSLLAVELEARGIARSAASAAMSVPKSRLTDIIDGRKRISIDTALRFERFLRDQRESLTGTPTGLITETGSKRQFVCD